MKRVVTSLTTCAVMLISVQALAADCTQAASSAKPYPTPVVADYVLGCMLANGSSPDSLRKCSCSIDFIAESIPYDDYETVNTLLRLQQMPGEGRAAVYKRSNWANKAIAHLREVQAESTLRCF